MVPLVELIEHGNIVVDATTEESDFMAVGTLGRIGAAVNAKSIATTISIAVYRYVSRRTR